MAKGKHSVALFEVIQKAKSSSRASSLRTPKWWFKGKKTDPAAPVIPVAPVVEESASTAPAPRVPGVDLKLDPDRKRIKFDVSYTSAIVAAFTVVVVVGLAYIIGSHMTRGPAAAMAGPTTPELLRGPATPSVMRVGGNVSSTPPLDRTPAVAKEETITTPPAPTPAPLMPAVEGRVRGRNYAIIQSLPSESKAKAFEIANYLKQNGIGATVEENVSGYIGWYVVMGVDDFSGPSDPAFKPYDGKVREVGAKYAKDNSLPRSSFLRFDDKPRLLRRWQGSEKTVSIN